MLFSDYLNIFCNSIKEAIIMKKYFCTDFDMFCHPSDRKEFSKLFHYINFKDLDYCPYIIYVACPTTNGELFGYFNVIPRFEIANIIYSDYCILAINYIDDVVLEVV